MAKFLFRWINNRKVRKDRALIKASTEAMRAQYYREDNPRRAQNILKKAWRRLQEQYN